MALKDWVRNDGYINTVPYTSDSYRDQEFIMLVREIQYQDVKTGTHNMFPTLYDVALANRGRNYIPVTDNTKLVQEPPNPNALRNRFY